MSTHESRDDKSPENADESQDNEQIERVVVLEDALRANKTRSYHLPDSEQPRTPRCDLVSEKQWVCANRSEVSDQLSSCGLCEKTKQPVLGTDEALALREIAIRNTIGEPSESTSTEAIAEALDIDAEQCYDLLSSIQGKKLAYDDGEWHTISRQQQASDWDVEKAIKIAEADGGEIQ